MGIQKPNSINEHIDRIKYLSKYSLKEAKYSLVTELENDDNIPDDIFTDPSGPSPVSPNNSNVMEAEPSSDELPSEDPALDDEQSIDPMTGEMDASMGGEEIPGEDPLADPMGGEEISGEEMIDAPVEPEKPSVDKIQNDILRTSISTMNRMNDELKNLETTIGGLNTKIDTLNKDVEEVREPTNVEKLMSKKEDSHPYYYNLNDMWDGNSFQARREVDNSRGMKKMEDGSFIADFDSLPRFTDQEVNDSF